MKHCKHCNDELKDNHAGLQCNTCRNGMQRYGLNKHDMIAMHESQNKKCAICSKEVELFSRRKANSAYIDHNHTTGDVRAILCHPCNTTIGYIESNKLNMDRLVEYLT